MTKIKAVSKISFNICLVIMILMTVAGGIIIVILIFVFARISKKHFNNLVEETNKDESSNSRVELHDRSELL